MRLLMVAMAAAALMVPAAPAYSQMGGNSSISKPMPRAPEKKEVVNPEQKKKDEKAYNDAITRIPDQKFDPWRSVR
jgi:hypothetical protein